MGPKHDSPFSASSESPIPSRRQRIMDEADELAGTTPFFSPSGSSMVEVPASSPPLSHKEPMLRLAPAGTVFRPYQAMSSKKRGRTQQFVNLVSDEDDYGQENREDQTIASSRGRIESSAFGLASFAYSSERDMQNKLRQIYDVVGEKYSSSLVRDALRLCEFDIEDAISWLDRRNTQGQRSPQHGHASVSKPRLIKGNKDKGKTLQSVKKVSMSPSPRKPQRRRLVQGVRKRSDEDSSLSSASNSSTPSSSSSSSSSSSQSDKMSFGENKGDDMDDAYQVEKEEDETSYEGVDETLTCINTGTLKELMAMTSLKEQLLEPMLRKRPFETLAQARKVCTTNKTQVRKAAKVCVGETVVEAVQVYLEAISAIDHVVSQCESKAHNINQAVDGWELDCHGHNKRSAGRARRGETDMTDMPPTPTSVSGSTRHKPCPIAKQPQYMDGHCVMKPFQLFGLNWMSLLYNRRVGCILADEMGLGKTCQVISLICHLVEDYHEQKSQRRPWPNLVVVPPSTYNNWLAEFERFAPDVSVIGYRGSQAERAAIADEVQQDGEAYHVVLATYSQINSDQDVESLRALGLNAAIFDEGHKMKNPETKIYKHLKRITAHWKMLLTGTPVQNNLMEMTALLSFINPDMFDGCIEHIKYIFSHKISVRDVSNGAFLYKERIKRARTILEPFILQRRKEQVVSDMVRKINAVVHCPMTEAQRPVYDEYESLFRLEPGQRAKKPGSRHNDVNNAWMQLRKAALHPLLFRRHFDDDKVEAMAKVLMDKVPQSELHQPDKKHLVQELCNASDFELHLWCRDYPQLLGRFDIAPSSLMDSGKVKMLLQLIRQYEENGDRVLVFSKFSRLIELLMEVLSLQNIEYRVLTGSTNVSERQMLIDEFNDNAGIPVFLLTTGAGGTGINLTAANKVIIFDQSDNPQDDIQAENRAHRLGQKRDVEVVRLISSTTIEELVYKACQKKIELAKKVTGTILDGDEEQDDEEETMEAKVRNMMMKDMTPP